MNEQEQEVLNLLGTAATKFCMLAELHSADRPEFVHAIHAAQNIVLARGALRALQNADQVDPRVSCLDT